MSLRAAKERRDGGSGGSQLATSLSVELHAVYDRVADAPLPMRFGRLIGELVFRDLYPFSTDFQPNSRSGRPK